MTGIRISQLGRAIVYRSVAWAKSPISLKTESFPKGSVPSHLKAFLFSKGGVPAKCAAETKGAAGAARVTDMNACVSRSLKK